MVSAGYTVILVPGGANHLENILQMFHSFQSAFAPQIMVLALVATIAFSDSESAEL